MCNFIFDICSFPYLQIGFLQNNSNYLKYYFQNLTMLVITVKKKIKKYMVNINILKYNLQKSKLFFIINSDVKRQHYNCIVLFNFRKGGIVYND